MTNLTEHAAVADDELHLTHSFDAPLSLVWRLWEDRDHLIRWWGPKDFTCTGFELDFRPGGRWRCTMVSEAYGTSRSGGVFREIEKPHRIVFTFAWEEGSGETNETVATVTFEERDGRTIQHFRQTGFRSIYARDRHVPGWTGHFNKLKAYAEAQVEADRS